MTPALSMWVIYDHPTDFPNHFVLRRWCNVPDVDCLTFDTLAQARAAVPDGLYCLPRFPQDDPNIVEVWL